MRIKISLFLLGIMLIFVGCNNSSNSEAHKKENKREILDESILQKWDKQENNDLEIYYPPAWNFNASGKMGALFVISSPLESEDDEFQDNINLVVYSLADSHIELSDYYLATMNDIKKQLLSVNIQEEKKLTNNEIEIQKVIFTTTQDDFVMTIQQYYFIHNQKAYIMTFTAEETKFDEYVEYVDLIMNSLKFKN